MQTGRDRHLHIPLDSATNIPPLKKMSLSI